MVACTSGESFAPPMPPGSCTSRTHLGVCRRHSDNLNNLVIASVSLGAERTFIMSPRMPSRSGKGRADKEDEVQDLERRQNVKWTCVSTMEFVLLAVAWHS